MNIEELYTEIAAIYPTAQSHNYFQYASQFRNNIQTLNSQKAQPPNAQNAPTINNMIAQLTTLKPKLLQSMRVVYNTAVDNNQVNQLTEELFGPAAQGLIQLYDVNMVATNEPNDVIKMIEGLLQKTQHYNNFYSTIRTLQNTTPELGLDSPSGIPSRTNTVALTFEDEAFIDDLVGLTKASKDWALIVHNFARLIGTNDTKAEILSVRRGSLIMTLLTDKGVITAISTCSIAVMGIIKQKLKLREKQMDIEKLEMDHQRKMEIIKLLGIDAKVKSDEHAKVIADSLVKHYFTPTTQNSEAEAETFTIKAVKLIFKYLSQGLKIKPKLLNPTNEELEQIKELDRLNIETTQQRQFLKAAGENQSLLIEHTDNEDEDDQESIDLNNLTEPSNKSHDGESDINEV